MNASVSVSPHTFVFAGRVARGQHNRFWLLGPDFDPSLHPEAVRLLMRRLGVTRDPITRAQAGGSADAIDAETARRHVRSS